MHAQFAKIYRVLKLIAIAYAIIVIPFITYYFLPLPTPITNPFEIWVIGLLGTMCLYAALAITLAIIYIIWAMIFICIMSVMLWIIDIVRWIKYGNTSTSTTQPA